MKMFIVLALAGVALAAGPVAAQTPDAKKIEAGKTAFATLRCSQCHAIGGTGGKLAGPLDGVGKKLTEADVRKWLTNATEMEAKLPKKPVMPMSTYLKTHKIADADVEALVAYMMSLK